MKQKLIVICIIVLLVASCIYNGPERSEYVGIYEIYSPTLYLSDSSRSFPDYESEDSLSTHYYFAEEKELRNSYIQINEDSTFFVKNDVLKDSVGTWDTFYDPELGANISLDFKNINAGALLYYDQEDTAFRIMEVSDMLLKDQTPFDDRTTQMKFIYKRRAK